LNLELFFKGFQQAVGIPHCAAASRRSSLNENQ
jgi:hypothetical protein